MALNPNLQALLDKARGTVEFAAEEVKLNFALSLERQRRQANISYSEMAQRIGTSAAYISKVFRGDANLTIETMVKLSRAVGSELSISASTTHNDFTDWGTVARLGRLKTPSRSTANGVANSEYSENPADNVFVFKKAA